VPCSLVLASAMASGEGASAKLVKASVADGVGHLRFANAAGLNALSERMRVEAMECLSSLSADPEVRCLVLSAEGDVFCAGIDLKELAPISQAGTSSGGPPLDPGRRASIISGFVQSFQDFVSAFERCPKPVVCAVHGPCIGGGLNLITACDVRFCSSNSVFSLREVRVGLAADVGGLQRLPKVVGCDSWVRDLALTGRDFGADEALRFGLVQEVLKTKEELEEKATKLAQAIAANSPLAVETTKANLNFSRDHSVADGLQHIMLMNRANLQAPDVQIAVQAFRKKEKPSFPNMPTSKL